MTQNIINLTIERIERMVREIVPELAEKMIQEEIKRLQKRRKGLIRFKKTITQIKILRHGKKSV